MTEFDVTKLCEVCKNVNNGRYWSTCKLTRRASGRDALTGEPKTTDESCDFTRSKHGYCGPEGKYWVKDPFWAWWYSDGPRTIMVGFASVLVLFGVLLVIFLGVDT